MQRYQVTTIFNPVNATTMDHLAFLYRLLAKIRAKKVKVNLQREIDLRCDSLEEEKSFGQGPPQPKRQKISQPQLPKIEMIQQPPSKLILKATVANAQRFKKSSEPDGPKKREQKLAQKKTVIEELLRVSVGRQQKQRQQQPQPDKQMSSKAETVQKTPRHKPVVKAPRNQ